MARNKQNAKKSTERKALCNQFATKATRKINPVEGLPGKNRRFYPGTVALRDIWKLQKLT